MRCDIVLSGSTVYFLCCGTTVSRRIDSATPIEKDYLFTITELYYTLEKALNLLFLLDHSVREKTDVTDETYRCGTRACFCPHPGCHAICHANSVRVSLWQASDKCHEKF